MNEFKFSFLRGTEPPRRATRADGRAALRCEQLYEPVGQDDRVLGEEGQTH
jgi:hypothetical protein